MLLTRLQCSLLCQLDLIVRVDVEMTNAFSQLRRVFNFNKESCIVDQRFMLHMVHILIHSKYILIVHYCSLILYYNLDMILMLVACESRV